MQSTYVGAGQSIPLDTFECYHCGLTVDEEYVIDHWFEVPNPAGKFPLGYSCEGCWLEHHIEQYTEEDVLEDYFD